MSGVEELNMAYVIQNDEIGFELEEIDNHIDQSLDEMELDEVEQTSDGYCMELNVCISNYAYGFCKS